MGFTFVISSPSGKIPNQINSKQNKSKAIAETTHLAGPNLSGLNIPRMINFLRFTGATDFVPAELEPRMVFSSRKVETFAAVMKRVNASIAKKPPNVNICNVQSIDYKIKSSWSNSSKRTNHQPFLN